MREKRDVSLEHPVCTWRATGAPVLLVHVANNVLEKEMSRVKRRFRSATVEASSRDCVRSVVRSSSIGAVHVDRDRHSRTLAYESVATSRGLNK